MKDNLARVVRPIATFAVSVGLVALVLAMLGYPLSEVLSALVTGSLGSTSAFRTSLGFAIPLLLVALGVGLSFRAGIFNLGAQGQFYIGALSSVVVGLAAGQQPAFIVVPVALAVGAAAGAVWSALCGVMLNIWRANEILTTLMSNFVAAGLLAWAAGGPLHNAGDPSAVSRPLEPSLRLSDATGWSASIAVVSLVACGLIWGLTKRTSFGLHVEMLGRNIEAARWMGVPIGRTRLAVFGITGAFAGLAGALVAYGATGSVSAGMSPNVGFTAILVAALGLLSVPGTVLASVVFGCLSAAIVYLPLATRVPASAVALFQGTVMALVTCHVTFSTIGRLSGRRRLNSKKHHIARIDAKTPTGVS